ncbi:MAG: hypothetical protein R3266_08885, partial [Gemmatimonadota bacterium]|nr:hypothetical protein [Gemmatimonadota bacterium]
VLRGAIRLFETLLRPLVPLESFLTGRRMRLTSRRLVFSVTGVTRLDGSVVLDSVGGEGLVAGGQAVLHGRGFSPIPSENDVRIEGERAEILDAAADRLTIRVPGFEGLCLPMREVGVRVLVGEDPSNGELWPLRPAEPVLALDPGETATADVGSGGACLQIPAAGEPREYRLAVGDWSRTPGRRDLRIISRRPAVTGGVGSGAFAVTRPELERSAREAVGVRARPDLAIRRNALRALADARVGPSRGAGDRGAGLPVVGDTLEHTFALGSDLTATCSDTANVVRGVVRAVGRHLALVEDVNAPPGGLGPEDWTALETELDRFGAPVDTAHFGPWADIDGNGRVIVLFTPEVNRLADPEDGSHVGGFFLPLDLAARSADASAAGGGEACPASNEAEILYLTVADPDGRHGPPLARDGALGITRSVVAHELQHLISAERRALRSPNGFAAVEEGWLDEALSQLAEEIVGFASLGLAPGGDYGLDQVANTSEELETFRTYHLDNFVNLRLYLSDPADTPTFESPSDEVGELRMRGFGWFLLRWLGDQAADERTLLRSLVAGGQRFTRGVENVERVAGRSWRDLLADFSVSVVADDAGIEGLPDRHRIATWDFRDVFTSLSGSAAAGSLFPDAFPLHTTRVPLETAALDFDVGASSVRFFELATRPDSPPLSIAVRIDGRGAPGQTTEPQVTIVRIR